MLTFDAAIIGAGAAGLHAAAMAGQRGLRVLLLDHTGKVAEKIRISGGGRCNFTNVDTSPVNFFSANPDFCKSALARYTPRDFIDLLERHRIGWHEKHKGQLFCDGASSAIIDMLLAECVMGGVERWQPCQVEAVREAGTGFALDTDRGRVRAEKLVIATGGLSIPQIGASDFGYRIARQFGHRIVETRPALVPLTMAGTEWAPWSGLAGVSLPVSIATAMPDKAGATPANAKRGRTSSVRFEEDLLFTHRGFSGPAALQISTYWRPGAALHIDCVPGSDMTAALLAAKDGPSRHLAGLLAESLPRRLAEAWLALTPAIPSRPIAELSDRELASVGRRLNDWAPVPDGTEGYRKAEVTSGGVDTKELDSRSLESRRRPGLYFIGEVVDVTGWLGGYNFQWAWASAAACARALKPATAPAAV